MLDRNLRARLIWTAERYNRSTRQSGRGGALGLAALAIYRVLLFRFGGDPQPSYEAIRTASGHCVDTIAKALHRLTDAGLLYVDRRTIRTRFGARRITNRYRFPTDVSLTPISREPLIQRLKKERLVPLETLSEGLQLALDMLQKRIERGSG